MIIERTVVRLLDFDFRMIIALKNNGMCYY